jgi:hypothetical protein
LGDLLGRMPSGMLQIVGESGWQLWHGERSRAAPRVFETKGKNL